jgi:hypothetical protein
VNDAGDRSRERVVFGLFVWEDSRTRWILLRIREMRTLPLLSDHDGARTIE